MEHRLSPIGGLIQRHLDRTGDRQAEFARKAGLSPQTVNQLLKGDIKTPSADVRRKLARALGVRHVDVLVLAGELTAEEIGARASDVPYDSARAAFAVLAGDLDEEDAHIVLRAARATAEALAERRRAIVAQSAGAPGKEPALALR